MPPHLHPTILIVDDNDDTRDGLTQLIRAEGYGVETARDGCEALRKLRDTHPCIILLDLHMPDMTGYDFRSAQLADEELRRIPVVIYSGAHNVADAAATLKVAGYATKPIVLDRLMAIIREHCLK